MGNMERALDDLKALHDKIAGSLGQRVREAVDRGRFRGDTFPPGARVFDPVTGMEGTIVATTHEHVLTPASDGSDGRGGVGATGRRPPGAEGGPRGDGDPEGAGR